MRSLSLIICALALSACQTMPQQQRDPKNSPVVAEIVAQKCAAYGIYIRDRSYHAQQMALVRAQFSGEDYRVAYRVGQAVAREIPNYCARSVVTIRSNPQAFVHLAVR